MEKTKRELSLDFAKPSRFSCGLQPTPSLVTPILAISSPELTRMIATNDELTLLTPNGISSVITPGLPQATVLPSPLIPTTVNNCDNILNNQSCNENSNQTSDYEDQNIEEKPRNRKQSKDVNKVDTEKIAKKRERNRLAAKKCRQRKIETIESLRVTVSKLQQDYRLLETDFNRYRAQMSKKIDQLTLENSELKQQIR